MRTYKELRESSKDSLKNVENYMKSFKKRRNFFEKLLKDVPLTSEVFEAGTSEGKKVNDKSKQQYIKLNGELLDLIRNIRRAMELHDNFLAISFK